MSLNRITAPSVKPVTESAVWDHLRLTMDAFGIEPHDKTHIAALIDAATSRLDGRDGILGRCLVPQTWDMSLDEFPHCREIPLRLPPIMSIVSVSYVDTAGDTQTMASADYTLSADRDWRPRLILAYNASWPSTRDQRDAVTIRTQCGYDSGNSPQDAAGVPEPIKHAMKLVIGHLYEHREQVIVGTNAVRLPESVDALLAPYRLLS